MFTGIIEAFAKVYNIEKEEHNIHLTLESSISCDLKVDQSIAHNGVCLTVVSCDEKFYTVTAIKETLDKTNLCLLYTSPSPRDVEESRMPSSA